MTTEEKTILLQDISARLPFGVKAIYDGETVDITKIDMEMETVFYRKDDTHYGWIGVELVKIWLRDFDDMTEEEEDECCDFCDSLRGAELFEYFNWLHENHISYRTHLGDDMFELGLAERIPKNVNPYDN